MKILHIVTSLNTGGIETMLVDIANEQVSTDDISVLILSRNVNHNILNKFSPKIKILIVARKVGSKKIIDLLKFNYYLSSLKPEIIHCHGSEIIRLILFKKKYKVYHTVHGINVPKGSISRYDKVFAISKSVQHDLKMRLGIDSIVVYNGIHIQQIFPKNDFHFDIFKIICVSRLMHQKKGQDILIKAIEILINKKNIKNIHVDFIGVGESLDYLKGILENFHLEKYVSFLGLKDREYIYKNLSNYQLLVQPSIYEGFGLTVVEGMAAKIPVLVSNIYGTMEIIDKGKYGFYFKVGDEKELADKIELIINNYQKKEIQNKIENAYEYVKVNFDVKLTAANYLKNY